VSRDGSSFQGLLVVGVVSVSLPMRSSVPAFLNFVMPLAGTPLAHLGGFMNFILYRINRQLDLLSTRADRIKPGPCRDCLIRRIARLNVAHHLILAKMKEAVAHD
jgi:hypothetical protein